MGVLSWIFSDQLGSTGITYQADGSGTVRQFYYPFGGIRNPGGSPVVDTDVGFTGQRLDTSTGLMFYQARYYDPSTARFISADTIVPDPGNPQDFNRYSYVRNNPLRYMDPTGNVPCGILEFIMGCRPSAGPAGRIATGGNPFVEVAARVPEVQPSDQGVATARLILSILPYSGGAIDMGDCTGGNNASCAMVAANAFPLFGFLKNVFKGFRAARFADDVVDAGRAADNVVDARRADEFANYGAEYLDDATRLSTRRIGSAAGTFDLPPYAQKRMVQRGISTDAVQKALAAEPFDYFHAGVWKAGFYDSASRVFVGTVGDVVTTVFKSPPSYVDNLKALEP